MLEIVFEVMMQGVRNTPKRDLLTHEADLFKLSRQMTAEQLTEFVHTLNAKGVVISDLT